MVYSGNKLLNANNGAFLFMIAFFTLVAINNPYLGVPFLLLCFLFTVNEAFYFELNRDEFIVKNYLLPFIRICYNLNEITFIEIQSTNYIATADGAVKITRDDKNSMPFRAASLGLKDWQALVDDLTDIKIAISVSASRLVDEIGIRED